MQRRETTSTRSHHRPTRSAVRRECMVATSILALVAGTAFAATAPGFEPLPVPATSAIDAMVQLVATDSIDGSVVSLQSFQNRRSDSIHGHAAGDWIAARFEATGVESVFVHAWSRVDAPNIAAIQTGTTRPHEIVLIGGHYDSIAGQNAFAPGADDNASGTSCVMECARILSQFRFERTLHFVAFSAEEFGLFGSNAYSAHLDSSEDSVVAVINVDMIGYRAERDRRDLDIISNAGSLWLRDAAVQAAAEHVPLLPLVDGQYPGTARSDQASFWGRGMPAISFYEDSDASSPFIHTLDDVYLLSYNDPTLAERSTQVAVALLAALAIPVTVPVSVQDLAGRWGDAGVEITWRLASSTVRAVRVERAAEAAGPWEVRGAALDAAPTMRFADSEVPDAASLWYRLALLDAAGDASIVGPFELHRGGAPRGLSLRVRNAQAPRDIEIEWALAVPGPTRLCVYDVRGRRVRGLASGIAGAGTHLGTWDRHDDTGQIVGRGVYLVHLQSGPAQLTHKLVLTSE